MNNLLTALKQADINFLLQDGDSFQSMMTRGLNLESEGTALRIRRYSVKPEFTIVQINVLLGLSLSLSSYIFKMRLTISFPT